ncbi:amidase domain-containing protein [Clostridium cellulovorans]|uniref:Putative amidase domain-containing protein n=1 Tax=Clostridium cellulovorans (strain ATCC 35296 / DSM 3052 / OCM 3 / 743B) TaxID=573061 RepID=D9SMB0_CLOC7|nr:amidase domain-containing protein [Clostridium cellulovorans]ADL53766.1 hypothetical protein Clocel_4104 [Clostridium cellulovorans 743B]
MDKKSKRRILLIRYIFFILLFCSSIISLVKGEAIDTVAAVTKEEAQEIIKDIFLIKNNSMIIGDLEPIKTIYNMKTKYGIWAYEYEQSRDRYLHNWEEKQGAEFIEINPDIVIKSVKGNKDSMSINFLCSTEYKYRYEKDPVAINSFRLGTYHVMSLAKSDNTWIVTKEWYKDPLGDSLDLKNLKVEAIRQYIVSQGPRDFSNLNERRRGAIAYAEQFCGSASEPKYGFKYNSKYVDFNPQGGDCANFASQILFEGGKFKKTAGWNYDRGSATGPWVNADKFKRYMLNSGRASVIDYGDYNKVYKSSYKLLPGDFVAYEKKGDITHISVVSGADSKGYSLVTCHNSDRNKVPWDLGWNETNVKFWLVRVHF